MVDSSLEFEIESCSVEGRPLCLHGVSTLTPVVVLRKGRGNKRLDFTAGYL